MIFRAYLLLTSDLYEKGSHVDEHFRSHLWSLILFVAQKRSAYNIRACSTSSWQFLFPEFLIFTLCKTPCCWVLEVGFNPVPTFDLVLPCYSLSWGLRWGCPIISYLSLPPSLQVDCSLKTVTPIALSSADFFRHTYRRAHARGHRPRRRWHVSRWLDT